MDETNPNVSAINLPKKFKVVLLGNQSVGKTSILKRYSEKCFNPNSDPTVGVDFVLKAETYNNHKIKLNIWDTAGQERFQSLIPSYIRDCAFAIVCYDVTSEESFEKVDNWIAEVVKSRGDESMIALVGNKVDMADDRIVSSEDGMSKAKEHEVLFVETSAKNDEGITELFRDIVQALAETHIDSNQNSREVAHIPTPEVKLDKKTIGANSEKKKKKCKC